MLVHVEEWPWESSLICELICRTRVLRWRSSDLCTESAMTAALDESDVQRSWHELKHVSWNSASSGGM